MKDIKYILIVDDDKEDQEFFIHVIQEIAPHVTIAQASSKSELFILLEEKTPDLLFVDSFIQHESGVASIREIRNNDKYKELPVIMYTGASEMERIEKAFKAGASTYVVKPYSLKEIKTVLQYLLEKDWTPLEQTPKQYYIRDHFNDYTDG